MRTKRGQQGWIRSLSVWLPVIGLLLVSVAAPLLFLAGRFGRHSSILDGDKALVGSILTDEERTRLHALQQTEDSFPFEMIKVTETSSDDLGPLDAQNGGKKQHVSQFNHIPRREALNFHEAKEGNIQAQGAINSGINKGSDHDEADPDTASRQGSRLELAQGINKAEAISEEQVINRRRGIQDNVFRKYSIWRQENKDSDTLVRLMKDQLIMGRVYISLANAQREPDLLQELSGRIKDIRRTLGQANFDSELPHSASEKAKVMGQALSKARQRLYHCKLVTKKLRAVLQGSEDHTRVLNKQSAVLQQLVAKTIPKGLHCLSLWLMSEYNSLPAEKKEFGGKEKLEDSTLYHYALFSDNIIATAVAINSTVSNAKEPELHVFHIVTDKLNYAAMKMWFLANPPGKATIFVQRIDDFSWLNSSYCPALSQLETAAAREYYFKSDNPATLANASANIKYRSPKYLSMLNHLRFYLPEIYPRLDKILFLDDDIVVQQDLTPLWSIDLMGNVNGAVETCGESFHQFDQYLNFSNPLIANTFDPNACGWAFGMNLFDLREWRRHDMTGVYHRWQALNERRDLWKLGTLPPGLITFYNLTYPLSKNWHKLGLGYDPNVETEDIEAAAVIHYNGNMKPWLDLAVAKYKPYWTHYLDLANPFLQHCNIRME